MVYLSQSPFSVLIRLHPSPSPTLTVPFNPSILIIQPFVHARSEGECPTPTGCTVASSLLASSRIIRHSLAEFGTNTRRGRHSNVFAQFEKIARDDSEEIEIGSNADCKSGVDIDPMSFMTESAQTFKGVYVTKIKMTRSPSQIFPTSFYILLKPRGEMIKRKQI